MYRFCYITQHVDIPQHTCTPPHERYSRGLPRTQTETPVVFSIVNELWLGEYDGLTEMCTQQKEIQTKAKLAVM